MGHRQNSAPLESLGGRGVRDLGGWPKGDGVRAFPLGDSIIDKLRTLWVLFCFMLRGRSYFHLKSDCRTARRVSGILQKVGVGWICG